MVFFGVAAGSVAGDRFHHADEAVDGVLALGFGRLDQHRAADDQREIDRHWVVAVFAERFGDVEGGDARLLLALVGQQAFVHAGAFVRRMIFALELA